MLEEPPWENARTLNGKRLRSNLSGRLVTARRNGAPVRRTGAAIVRCAVMLELHSHARCSASNACPSCAARSWPPPGAAGSAFLHGAKIFAQYGEY